SLNVFPVPDGDTGTNLLLTMRGVVEALDVSGSAGELARTVADASLMSARGNSGVILAQVLRAMVGVLEGRTREGALADAATAAGGAVPGRREGTVLPVLSDAAAAAVTAAAAGAPLDEVAAAARDAAAASLEGTTTARPELAAAGVVDAGGLGAVLLL